MKSLRILLAALSAAMFIFPSCDKGSPKPLSDFKDADLDDSLMYYYGTMRAADYWHACEADTFLRGKEAREQYMQGLIDGMNAFKEGNNAYNEGFRQGVRSAVVANNIAEDLDHKLKREYFISGFRYGMEKDSSINSAKTQRLYMKAKSKLERQVEKADAESGLKKLARYAQNNGFKKINDRIYGYTYHPGTGALVRKGDVVYVDVSYMHTNGINLGMPSPKSLTVGSAGIPEVVTAGYENMRKGSAVYFLTTAEELWGDRADIIGLAPSDLVKISVKVNDVVRAGSQTPAEADTVNTGISAIE